MRATNPRKAMKCGIYHTRVLVAVYSFFLMIKPYNRLELRYDIENKVKEHIKKYGTIEKAIVQCKSMLSECEEIWEECSYDCVGHGITCNQLLIPRLEEQLAISLNGY